MENYQGRIGIGISKVCRDEAVAFFFSFTSEKAENIYMCVFNGEGWTSQWTFTECKKKKTHKLKQFTSLWGGNGFTTLACIYFHKSPSLTERKDQIS